MPVDLYYYSSLISLFALQSGQAVPSVQNTSPGVGSLNNAGNEQIGTADVNGGRQSNVSLPGCTSESEVQKVFSGHL